MPKISNALFLDRDGVINFEKDYLFEIGEVEFVPGIFELTKFARSNRYKVVIVTNQSGIARGFYKEDQFLKLMDWMCGVFEGNGSGIDAIYYCPFHPDQGIGSYKKDSELRKPRPGMILQAQAEHSLDLVNSFLIGDRLSDMHAGLAAGVGNNFLLTKESVDRGLQRGLRTSQSLDEIIPYFEKEKRFS